MPRDLRVLLGQWAPLIKQLQARAQNNHEPERYKIIGQKRIQRSPRELARLYRRMHREDEAIEDGVTFILTEFYHDLVKRSREPEETRLQTSAAWAVEALFHPEVYELLTPLFFQNFKVGDGQLLFVDGIMRNGAHGAKAELVWTAILIDSQKSEPEEGDFVSEDTRAFVSEILKMTPLALESAAYVLWRKSPVYEAWSALTEVMRHIEERYSRQEYYQGIGDYVGALSLARSYYNELRRLDHLRVAYEFLQHEF